MSQETETLLRTILYQAKLSDEIEDIVSAVEAMCSQETIAFINEKVAETKKRRAKK